MLKVSLQLFYKEMCMCVFKNDKKPFLLYCYFQENWDSAIGKVGHILDP